MLKTVSVIVPCYNVGAFVRKTIPTLLNQTYQCLEIILIDDGSTDNTFEVLEELSFIDSRILLVKNDHNLGLIKTLNNALSLSTGDYVARFDADDYLTPDRINNQINVVEQDPSVDLVTTFSDYYDYKGRYHSFVETFMGTGNFSATFIGLFETPLLHAGLLIKASIIKQIGYNESEIAHHIEDYVLFMNLLCSGKKLVVLTEKQNRYHYTRNFTSVSNKNKELQNEHVIAYSALILKDILNIELDNTTHRQIELRNFSDWSYANLVKGISALKGIKKEYVAKYSNEISNQDKKEIQTWVALRSLKMIVITFLHVSIIAKASVLYVLFREIAIFTELRAYRSIFNRVIGQLNNLR